MNNEILDTARECNVPDTSCNPEGELMPWVIAFYNAAFNAGVEAAAKEAELWEQCGDYMAPAIRTLKVKK